MVDLSEKNLAFRLAYEFIMESIEEDQELKNLEFPILIISFDE